MKINDLPEEMLIAVFRKLDSVVQTRIQRVCVKWAHILHQHPFQTEITLPIPIQFHPRTPLFVKWMIQKLLTSKVTKVICVYSAAKSCNVSGNPIIQHAQLEPHFYSELFESRHWQNVRTLVMLGVPLRIVWFSQSAEGDADCKLYGWFFQSRPERFPTLKVIDCAVDIFYWRENWAGMDYETYAGACRLDDGVFAEDERAILHGDNNWNMNRLSGTLGKDILPLTEQEKISILRRHAIADSMYPDHRQSLSFARYLQMQRVRENLKAPPEPIVIRDADPF